MNQQQNQWAGNNPNMNGSNMSLNMPMQGYYPSNGEQPVWGQNAWGQPMMYPYPGMPQNGEYNIFVM